MVIADRAGLRIYIPACARPAAVFVPPSEEGAVGSLRGARVFAAHLHSDSAGGPPRGAALPKKGPPLFEGAPPNFWFGGPPFFSPSTLRVFSRGAPHGWDIGVGG